jgi:hypothetical protein
MGATTDQEDVMAEIGGRVRSAISKITSSLLPFGQEEADEGEPIVDATKEVLVFVRHISTLDLRALALDLLSYGELEMEMDFKTQVSTGLCTTFFPPSIGCAAGFLPRMASSRCGCCCYTCNLGRREGSTHWWWCSSALASRVAPANEFRPRQPQMSPYRGVGMYYFSAPRP